MSSGERQPIIPNPQPSSTDEDLSNKTQSQSSQSKTWHLLFVSIVVVMVLITIALSIYRSADATSHGTLYLLLGINLIGLCSLEIIMIWFVRTGHLAEAKTWFLYVVGGAVLLESIFTDVAIFRGS